MRKERVSVEIGQKQKQETKKEHKNITKKRIRYLKSNKSS
jgi:hypothetical protein